MRAGKNVWININEAGKTTKSECCPGFGWVAHYPASRVHGDRYTPYQGGTPWIHSANRSMKMAAQDNFQNRR